MVSSHASSNRTNQKVKTAPPSNTISSSSSSSSSSKTDKTIEQLNALLDATPAAEELASTWYGTAASNGESERKPCLQDLHRVLESGKRISRGENGDRGVPMAVVVRMCKASWHRDGTWPLLGCDETAEIDGDVPASARSLHPAALLLRPANTSGYQPPAPQPP